MKKNRSVNNDQLTEQSSTKGQLTERSSTKQ